MVKPAMYDQYKELESLWEKAERGELEFKLTKEDNDMIKANPPSKEVQSVFGAASHFYNNFTKGSKLFDFSQIGDSLKRAMIEVVNEEYEHNDLLIDALLERYQELHMKHKDQVQLFAESYASEIQDREE